MVEVSTIEVGEEQNGVLGAMSVSRHRFMGPEEEGVTVRICIDRGAIMVYGSYTVPNPNAAFNDFSDFLSATEGEVMSFNCSVSHITIDNVMEVVNDCSQCNLGLQGRKKRQEEEEARMVVVYITIEGVSDTGNQFSINSSIGSAFGKMIAT